MEKGLKEAKLLGKGPNKLQGGDHYTLEMSCKTAICEAIELSREFETKPEKKMAALLRMKQCKMHVNGQHDECPDNAVCHMNNDENQSFLLENKNKFGEKERSLVNKVVFDDLLCSSKFIEANCIDVGSTSANENLHGMIYGRNLISKKTHKNTFTNSIEAGYKCGVLFNNEGDSGTFDILFNQTSLNNAHFKL